MANKDEVRRRWALLEVEALERGDLMPLLTEEETASLYVALRRIDRSARLVRRVIERDSTLRRQRDELNKRSQDRSAPSREEELE